MGCNCKNKSGNILADGAEPAKKNLNTSEKVVVFIAKTLGFIIGGAIMSVIVIPFSLYTLFKIIYLEESIDITGAMVNVGKFLRIGKEEDDILDEEMLDEDFDPNDYELDGVDEIIQEKTD